MDIYSIRGVLISWGNYFSSYSTTTQHVSIQLHGNHEHTVLISGSFTKRKGFLELFTEDLLSLTQGLTVSMVAWSVQHVSYPFDIHSKSNKSLYKSTVAAWGTGNRSHGFVLWQHCFMDLYIIVFTYVPLGRALHMVCGEERSSGPFASLLGKLCLDKNKQDRNLSGKSVGNDMWKMPLVPYETCIYIFFLQILSFLFLKIYLINFFFFLNESGSQNPRFRSHHGLWKFSS